MAHDRARRARTRAATLMVGSTRRGTNFVILMARLYTGAGGSRPTEAILADPRLVRCAVVLKHTHGRHDLL